MDSSTVAPENLEHQLDLEREMAERGANRYHRTLRSAREKQREATTAYGQTFLARSIEPFSIELARFLELAFSGSPGKRHKAANLLKDMDPHTVAFLTLRQLMDTLTRTSLLSSLAIKVAREIEIERKLRHFATEDKSRFDATRRHIQGHGSRSYRKTVMTYAFNKSGLVSWEPWKETDCLHLGLKLIDLAVQTTGLFQISQRRKAKGQGYSYILGPTQQCQEWLQHHDEAASLLTPDFLPTIIPPKPWCGAWGGGYYSQASFTLSLVKTNNVKYLHNLDDQIQAGRMPQVLKAINALQNTAWVINKKVLDVVTHIWEHTEGGVAGIPVRDGYRLPLCPVCGQDITESANARVRHACLDTLSPEVFRSWRRDAATIRERNISEFSKRMMVAKIIHLAQRFAQVDQFYYPYQLDFRGRIYAVPPYLTPQGPDLAKGLLRFAQGKPLGSMEAVKWLAIQGANTWGYDKASLDERQSWVAAHQERILAVADDPLTHTWWHEADSPFCFLSFCLEWQGYVKNGLAHVSNLPVAMDGTCNGLQIFSLILRDKVGGAAVNLLPAEKPQDIYQIVADKVIARLKKDALRPGEDVPILAKKTRKPLYKPRHSAGLLLSLGVDRSTTKRQVMVLPYGGTRESCREYTQEWVQKKLYQSALQLPDDCTVFGLSVYLSGHIWEAIGETVIAARDAMTFLQDCATVLSRAGKPIRWTTPCNLPVLQHYRPLAGHRVKTQLGDSLVYFTLNQERDENAVDAARQRSALSPNFVHSLDASALMETVCLCLDHGIQSYAMIHDSYGTHAADSPALARHLRRSFVQLFGGSHTLNHLEVFRRELAAQLPLELHGQLPDVPPTGTLNVALVEQSPFFFA